MSLTARLSIALTSGSPALDQGAIAVFGPRKDDILTELPKSACRIITGFYPDHSYFTRAGFDCGLTPEPGTTYTAALVVLPRAKAKARDMIAQARAVTNGPVIVDGAKQDGIESMLKECRKRADVAAPISKAHGKMFWFSDGDFSDWRAPETQTIEIAAQSGEITDPAGASDTATRFQTAPGVFSADGVDPASALLIAHLPADLGRRVIDLGAGWGYLAARALTRDTIRQIDLVEADHTALVCAKANITDPRAQFHWADATDWVSPALADSVIMNPPFHQTRRADPDIGRAFIAAAARSLSPNGRLYMVANRHLPYEPALAEHFANVDEIAGTGAFKIIAASHPARHRRRDRLR